MLNEDSKETMFFKALMIVAQTGKGKNYWLLNVLRPFAMKKRKKILYLCNRTALSHQQVEDARKAVDPTRSKQSWDEDIEEYLIGSITLMTYHRYYELIKKHGEAVFRMYDYCVADEAHFFYADAMFCPDTEDILKSIPSVFKGKFRFYMTATPNAVYDLIYWAEWNSIDFGPMAPSNCKANIVVDSRFPEIIAVSEKDSELLSTLSVVKFKYDYTTYKDLHFFGKKEIILEAVLNDESNEKWIVFVKSKAVGKDMEEKLRSNNIKSLYIDSESRSSEDISVRYKWEYLQENGNLGEYRVLITTSVLDNGFSIKDKDVGNIVLFAEDETEFLQELGRIRLERGQKVKVYISKMNEQSRLHPNTRNWILDVFVVYYGSENITEYYPPNTEIKPDKIRARELAKKYKFGFMGEKVVHHEGEVALKPYINNIARYVARRMKEEAEEYASMKKERKDASVQYKLKWLEGLKECSYIDLDIPEGERVAEELEKLLLEHWDNNRAMEESSQEFKIFSNEFFIFYCEKNPKDSAINTGTDRKYWKNTAINNRFKTLSEKWNEIPLYQLEKTTYDKNKWCLVKQDIGTYDESKK